MASENIYSQFAQPLRSVQDYSNEMDQRDLNKLRLEGETRKNMLAGLVAQQQQQTMADGQRSQNVIRQVYAGMGADAAPDARFAALRRTGDRAAIDLADAQEKAFIERRRAESEAGFKDVETENKVIATYRDLIGSAANPQQAAQYVQIMHSDPRLKSTAIARVPLDQALSQIGGDPQTFNQWKQQFALGAAKFVEMNKPQYMQSNLGGTNRITALPGLGGAPSVASEAPITQSADNIATQATSRRGQNMTDARARDANDLQRAAQRTQIVDTPNGPMVVDKGTGQGRPVTAADGKPVPGDSAMKRESGAKRVLSLLDQAEKLIPEATGSYAGAAVDMGARVVGAAPGGAQAIAKLKALEGSLLAEMPRMEGPQSNADVAMYRQAAGEIGDPTAPRAAKLAALETIREVQQRYAGVQPAPKPREGGATGAFDDAAKEQRYQEWKRQQGQR